jgi:hypothetical protein
MSTDSTLAPSRFALLTAFAIVYVIWGSTFLAILFAIETLPPFAALRVVAHRERCACPQ